MILIGLGSSLSFWGQNPPQVISCAVHALSSLGKVAAASRLYESPAWPDPSDPVFFNACVALDSRLEPLTLLAGMRAIEAGFGRRRGKSNAPRTLDLDLLDYQGLRLSNPGPPPLELPHPRLEDRSFVILPLRDVAPSWRHPVSGVSIDLLVKALGDPAAHPVAGAPPLLP